MRLPAREPRVTTGNRYLLDTNALVALLQGHSALTQRIQNADWLGISVINALEFLSFDGLSQHDHDLFMALTQRIEVLDISMTNLALFNAITDLRKSKRLKLPDAIILASAIERKAVLLTADVQLLKCHEPNSSLQVLAF